MRLTVAGDRRTSRTTVCYRLDEIAEASRKLQLLLHYHHSLHPLAEAWAHEHLRPVVMVGDPRVGLFGPRHTARIAWETVFRTYKPDVLLFFGHQLDEDAEKDRILRRLTEDHGTEIWYTPPVYGPHKELPRVEARCGAPSPSGKVFCTKFLRHPGGWHAHFKDGRRRSAWRDEDCQRRSEVARPEP